LSSGRRRTIFVYGSLLRGESNHERLAGARFLGEARSAPSFSLVDLGAYPGLVRGGGRVVHGEVYVVPPALLVKLDAFEGHPRLYRRRRILLEDGRWVEAYLLAKAPPAPVHIESGRWRDRASIPRGAPASGARGAPRPPRG
jgi:gamma-glutamylcyclotransferase (GGCT)/AIG2-like uncharacterized protein YtfP